MKDMEVLENITEVYVDVDDAIVDIENNPTEVYTEQLETNIDIDDENIVEIEISEAFPFSSEGVLDSMFGNKDVLIDGGEVNDVNNDTITMQEVLENCAALGGLENVSHGALIGRELDGQHPISAITGLREELDDITALKTVYSNGKGFAQYYMWNEKMEDNVGHFVTKLSNDTIQIIDATDEDIFGVVVDDAGFICNQDIVPRNSSYGLVVYAGEVDVRCESDVEVGDYVISNDAGYAKKSTSGKGYKVTAVYKPHDISFATISLVLSANQINDLGEDVQDLSDRMTKAEADVTTAINTAQTAISLASAGGGSGSINASTIAKVEEALNNSEIALDTAEGLNSQIQSAVQSSAQAKKIASDALASASSIKAEAVEKSNQALEDAVAAVNEIKQLKNDMTPLSEWKDDKGNSSFAGFVAKSDEDSAILADMVEWQGEVNGGTIESIASISRKADANESKISALTNFESEARTSIGELQVKSSDNESYIQGFVANIDKYSYGRYSQANKFTYEEALNILELGVIYVPSEDHEEKYGTTTYRFDKGRYYTWSTSTNEQGQTIRAWVGSNDTSVKFSSTYVTGNTIAPYWVAEADVIVDEKVAYEKDCLYKWENEMWIKVATAKGNLGAVTTSIFKQTSDSIEAAVTDVNNNYAGTKNWVDSYGAKTQTVVEWHGQNVDAIATTIQRASDAEAYIGQVASVKNPDGTVNAIASIVAEVNKDSSSVSIDADKINFTGFTTFVRPGELSTSGATTINGNNITTGTISSSSYTDNNSTVYSDAGTRFNLSDGSIVAPNFAVTNDGVLNAKNAIIEGDITATSLTLGNNVLISTDDIDGLSGVATSGDYNDLSNLPTIPESLSDLTDDMDVMIKSDINISTKTNDSTGITTTTTTIGDNTYTTYTSKDANYLLTNLGVTDGKSYFMVDKDGLLEAKNAMIWGTIYATDGEFSGTVTTQNGKIGKWNLMGDYLYSELDRAGTIDIGGANFSYTKLFSGLCTWSSLDWSSFLAETKPSLVTSGFYSPVRFYAGAPQLQGENNQALCYSRFAVLEDGSLYASAADIKGNITATSGSFDNCTIKDTCTINGKLAGNFIHCHEGDAYTGLIEFWETTDGIRGSSYTFQLQSTAENGKSASLILGMEGNYAAYASLTAHNIDITANTKGYLSGSWQLGNSGRDSYLYGTWYTDNEIVTTSDRNAKNSIQDISDAYEILFDNLQSKIFKYNDGTSDRYHTGFEAQGVDEARQKAGLTRQDFAAVCIVGEGTEKEEWGLRYSEFVSLNTWQIQKLKARVTELEERIAKLEQ